MTIPNFQAVHSDSQQGEKLKKRPNNTMQKQTNKSFNSARVLEDVAYLFLMT